MVGVSHGNLPRVKELVSARPALARASWDWGYGDWEAAIDAASHVGNRPIAEYLIANGARPTIYTAAMMGQLAIVKGGSRRCRGPAEPRAARHHAAGARPERRRGRGGGAEVSRVARRRRPRYTTLRSATPIRPRSPESTRSGRRDRAVKVAKNARGIPHDQRPGHSERNLAHQGPWRSFRSARGGPDTIRSRREESTGR
jgi:hypothetical protein